MNCNHVFPYWSVQPPSHCPCCGACLHAVKVAPYPPVMPWQPVPWPYGRPYYSSTVGIVSTTNTNSAMVAA